MNDVSQPDSIPTPGRPKAVRVRTYRAALHEPGASRLSAEEIAIVTQALVILENKVVRKLKPGEIMRNPERVKQWLILHYGMLDREVFGLIIPRRPPSIPGASATLQWRHSRRRPSTRGKWRGRFSTITRPPLSPCIATRVLWPNPPTRMSSSRNV